MTTPLGHLSASSAELGNPLAAERAQSPSTTLPRDLTALVQALSAGDGVDGATSAGCALSPPLLGGGARAVDRGLSPGVFLTLYNPEFDWTPPAQQPYTATSNAVWGLSPGTHRAGVNVNAVATLEGARLCTLRAVLLRLSSDLT